MNLATGPPLRLGNQSHFTSRLNSFLLSESAIKQNDAHLGVQRSLTPDDNESLTTETHTLQVLQSVISNPRRSAADRAVHWVLLTT